MTVELAGLECPVCRLRIASVYQLVKGQRAEPELGDSTVCARCGRALAVTEGGLREMDLQDWMGLGPEDRAGLMKFRAWVLAQPL